MKDHVQTQLKNPTGGFYESKNGIDSEVAKEWEEKGICRIVPPAAKASAAVAEPVVKEAAEPATLRKAPKTK